MGRPLRGGWLTGPVLVQPARLELALLGEAAEGVVTAASAGVMFF